MTRRGRRRFGLPTLSGLQLHAAAGYRWLRLRLNDDGKWSSDSDYGVDAYYKAPWSFSALADDAAATHTLSHIDRSFLRPDGDLVPLKGLNLRERYPLLPHAHVAIGALDLGQREVANRLLDFLSQHRHRQLGAWGDRVGEARTPRFDSISTATIGLAFLEANRLEEARAAGEFLERLLNIQPNPQSEFFTSVLSAGGLITEFADPKIAIDRRVGLTAPFQVWHAIGYPILLSARLFEVEDDDRWRDLADQYIDLLDRSRQAWIDLSIGKAAWGCTVLYRVTGDPVYLQRAMRAIRGLVSWQDRDGGWLGCLDGKGGTPRAPTSVGFEVSSELAQWLAMVGETVAEHHRVPWQVPAESGDETALEHCARQAELSLIRQARKSPARLRKARRKAQHALSRR